MRTLLIICLCLFVWSLAHGQSVEVVRTQPVRNLFDYAHTYITEGKIGIEWAFYDEARVWLEIRSADKGNWPNEGFNPSYTSITCNYRPVVRKLADNRYEITFQSEIAKDMP